MLIHNLSLLSDKYEPRVVKSVINLSLRLCSQYCYC
nr:MAG TPA: hypothetical protein [Caudoviricetes sp.]